MKIEESIGNKLGTFAFSYSPTHGTVEVDGVVKKLSDILLESEIAEIQEDELAVRFRSAVHVERDRRITEGSVFTLDGGKSIRLTGDETTITNLGGAAVASLARLAAGDTSTVIQWRDADNTDHDLSPSEVVELHAKAVGFVSGLFRKAQEIKDADPRPADPLNPAIWE